MQIAMSDLASTKAPGQGSWLRVASLMGCKPEMAVLRKFQRLNVLRLLEMQSELAQQESDYEMLCSLEANLDCPTTRSYQTDWTALNESQGLGSSLQRDAWRKLRDSLESYSMCTSMCFSTREESLTSPKNNALLQQIKICKQDGPSEHDLSILRSWLDCPKGNNCSLRGPGWDVWKAREGQLRDTENDFLVLSSKHSNRDRFERWTGDTLLQVYHRHIGRRFKVSRTFYACYDMLTV